MEIIEIKEPDFAAWYEMACELWPEDQSEMGEILRTILKDPWNKNFISKSESGLATGFINLSIRSDYVEGSDSSPVVFIEGIYVKPEFRNQGIAKGLVNKAEAWGKEIGCTEIGSDAYDSNLDSRNFHKSLGFKESEPIVVFTKSIRI